MASPLEGAGAKLLDEISSYSDALSSKQELNRADILYSISEAYPAGFKKTWIILDHQDAEDNIFTHQNWNTLMEIIQGLNSIQLITTTFVHPPYWHKKIKQSPSLPIFEIDWTSRQNEQTPNYLLQLLTYYLCKVNETSINNWCQTPAKDPDLDNQIVEAAKGTPANLLKICTQLLEKIGEDQAKLDSTDLNEILGK